MNSEKQDYHLGVRITALDATRATEQTAILMALILGRLGKKTGPRPDRPKLLAWRSMLGYLRMLSIGQTKLAFDHSGSLHDGHFVDEFVPNPKESRAEKRSRIDHVADFCRKCAEPHTPEKTSMLQLKKIELDFVASPVDVATACYRGLAGTVSVLAGGEERSFVAPKDEWYWVVATSSALLKKQPRWNPIPALEALGQTEVLLSMAADTLLKDLFKNNVEEKHQDSFVTSTVLPHGKQHDDLASVCGDRSRMRISSGSPIAGALGTYVVNSQLDMFTAVVTPVQATLIAVAARATGGGFIALPVVGGPKDYPHAKDCKVKTSVLSDTNFVEPKADVFLNATGISNSFVLGGVRFDERDDNVVTQTLSLRTLTQSQRQVTHVHNQLSVRDFHVLNEALEVDKMTHKQIAEEIRSMIPAAK